MEFGTLVPHLGGPSGGPSSLPSGIILSNNEVPEGAANDTVVGYLLPIGGTAPFTFSEDATYFKVTGNELQVAADTTGQTDETFSVTVTDALGFQFTTDLTVDIAAVSNGSGVNAGDGTLVVDSGFDIDPKDHDTNNGLRISGRSGGTAKLLYSIGTPEYSGVYTMRYNADWSQLSKEGRKAGVFFGFKEGDDWHFIGIKGDGEVATTMRVTDIYSDDFAAGSGHTTLDSGAASNGTKDGDNYLQLEIAADGGTATLRTSSNGSSWDNERVTVELPPLTDPVDALQFGPGVFFENDDKGVFSIDIELWQVVAEVSSLTYVAAWAGQGSGSPITTTIPAAVQVGDVLIAHLSTGGSTTTPAASGAVVMNHVTQSVNAANFIRKVITSADKTAGSITWTGPGGGFNWYFTGLFFRPNRTATTLSHGSGGAQITNGDLAQQTIAAGTACYLAIGSVFHYNTTNPAFTSVSSGMTQVAPGGKMRFAYQIFDKGGTSPVSRSIDAGDFGNDHSMCSRWVRVQ